MTEQITSVADQQQPITPMIEQITLQQALKLVDFDQGSDGTWRVKTVKGHCSTVEGYCSIVAGGCNTVKGYCITVQGNCGTVEGDCGSVEGHVHGTISGRQWQYVETPKEKMTRLIEQGASKEELLKAPEEL
jgi:hypothetical protein